MIQKQNEQQKNGKEPAIIRLLPKQVEAWECFLDPEITELGYGGAAGGGKTRLGWYLAIYIAQEFPGSRGAVARKELKTLRLTTLAELWTIFSEMGFRRDKDYRYNEKDGVIRFRNKSEILLLDTARQSEDPEYTRFGSLPLSWAWIEESNESPEKAISILKTRVGRSNRFIINGKKVEMKPFWLETFNPNKGYVYRQYFRPWKDGKLPSYRSFIRALPGDNPHLIDAYIKGLERSDRTTQERLLKGNFDYDADPMKIMNYDAIVDMRTNTLGERPLHERQRYLINDIARNGGDKIVIGEFEDYTLVGLGCYTHQGTDETAQQVKDQATESKIPYSQILSDEGGVGGGAIDQMKGTKGFIGNARPMTMIDTFSGKEIAQNYTNLRSQCYFTLGDFVNNHSMAIKLRYFKTNIEGFTEEMALAELEDDLDAVKKIVSEGSQSTKQAIIPKAEMKTVLGRSPDIGDIMMMRMMFEFKPPRLPGNQDAKAPRVKVASQKIVINKAY